MEIKVNAPVWDKDLVEKLTFEKEHNLFPNEIKFFKYDYCTFHVFGKDAVRICALLGCKPSRLVDGGFFREIGLDRFLTVVEPILRQKGIKYRIYDRQTELGECTYFYTMWPAN